MIKKIRFKIIFIFFMCILILSCYISVSATYNYFAKNVMYQKKEGTEISVDSALNELYSQKNETTYDKLVKSHIKSINGAKILKDKNNDLFFYFDGIDDNIEIDSLSSEINWHDGIKIETKIQVDSFKTWARIFQFSNDEGYTDFIGVSLGNALGNAEYFMYNGKSDKAFNIPLGYEANSIINLKIEYLKNSENNFDVKMYIDGKMLYSTKTDATIRNVERSYSYVGSGNNEPYFNGRIYDLKIEQADGTEIINIDANKIFN